MSRADRENKHNDTAVLKRPADNCNWIKKEKGKENPVERADLKIRFRKCIFSVKRAHPIINPDKLNYFRKVSKQLIRQLGRMGVGRTRGAVRHRGAEGRTQRGPELGGAPRRAQTPKSQVFKYSAGQNPKQATMEGYEEWLG